MVDSVSGNNSHSVLKGTMVSGGVGATIAGGVEYLSQRQILKNPQLQIDKFEGIVKELEETGMAPKFKEFAKKWIDNTLKPFIKEGKISARRIGTAATIGAVGVAGIYLLCRGVKALFGKKD